MNSADLLAASPPADTATEQALLGAMLVDPSQIPAATALVSAAQFADTDQGALFHALVLLHEAGKPVGDLRLLLPEFARLNVPEAMRVPAFLNRLINAAVAHNAPLYAARIAELATLRQYRDVALHLLSRVHASTATTATVADWLREKMAALESHGQRHEALTVAEIGDTVLADLRAAIASGKPRGIFSGFPEIDEQLGGFQAGELAILAARTGNGKTTWATQVALHAAERGKTVLFVSLEMAQAELVRRLLCGAAAVATQDVRRGALATWQVDRLAQANDSMRQLPFHIWAPPTASVERIAGMARLVGSNTPLGLVVVDYIGFVSPTDSRAQRREQVAHVSRNLKALAKELGLPVLALAQLNREAQDTRPNNAMLRDSGALEEDADMVLFLHRPKEEQQTEFIVSKHRHGEVGILALGWDRQRLRYVEASEPPRPAPARTETFDDWNDQPASDCRHERTSEAPAENGRVRTTCNDCGSFVGYRPA